MTMFVYPDGGMVCLEAELCEIYEDKINDYGDDEFNLLMAVSDVLYECGYDGVPSWWKQLYKHQIINAVIQDMHSTGMGIVHNSRADEWYVSAEVPYGQVEFR